MLDRCIDKADLPDWIPSYTDLEPDHWAYAAIMEASIDHEYTRKEDGNEIWTNQITEEKISRSAFLAPNTTLQSALPANFASLPTPASASRTAFTASFAAAFAYTAPVAYAASFAYAALVAYAALAAATQTVTYTYKTAHIPGPGAYEAASASKSSDVYYIVNAVRHAGLPTVSGGAEKQLAIDLAVAFGDISATRQKAIADALDTVKADLEAKNVTVTIEGLAGIGGRSAPPLSTLNYPLSIAYVADAYEWKPGALRAVLHASDGADIGVSAAAVSAAAAAVSAAAAKLNNKGITYIAATSQANASGLTAVLRNTLEGREIASADTAALAAALSAYL